MRSEFQICVVCLEKEIPPEPGKLPTDNTFRPLVPYSHLCRKSLTTEKTGDRISHVLQSIAEIDCKTFCSF
jgi:hypothetical protein